MTINKMGIVDMLLVWIEDHLEQPLSIDEVARKSGYSKWHLQRLFKEVTGQSVGTYTRGRRLSKAAVALRLTSRSILDISTQYNFDSQQSFTRAFKGQFDKTPARYRRAENWSARGILPPTRANEQEIPLHSFVTLPDTTLIGNTLSYRCKLEEISANRQRMRGEFWQQLLKKSFPVPPIIYGLHMVQPSTVRNEEQEVYYSSAIEIDELAQTLNAHHQVEVKGGDYVKFSYQGHHDGLQAFILLVYNTCFPTLGLTRRKGKDIERFHTRSQIWTEELPTTIHCDYYIPVLREGEESDSSVLINE